MEEGSNSDFDAAKFNFFSGSGMQYTSYAGLYGKVGNEDQLRTKIINKDSVLNTLIKEEGKLGEFEIYEPTYDYAGKWVRGYFSPPQTGNYIFRMTAS